MKKIFAVISALALLFTLAACGSGGKTHEEILKEISEKNSAYQEKRQAFLSSDVCAEARAFVTDALSGLLPGCTAQITLEPGSLIDADLSEFSGLAEDEAARKKFFSDADLYIKINYRDFEADAEELCGELAVLGISGRLAADEYGADTYNFDAVTGKTELYIMPAV